jgi:Predicted transcriptional regulators
MVECFPQLFIEFFIPFAYNKPVGTENKKEGCKMEEITIGARIKNRRKELGLTQEELAKRIGVTFQAVSKWENDTSYPDIILIAAVARTLNMTTDEIIYGKKDEAAKKEEKRPFYGKIFGNVDKDIHADVGKIMGNVQGDIYGDVKGDIMGTVKNVFGNIEGNVFGTINGDVTGYIKGSLMGTVTGSVKQGVHGRIHGQIIGDGINVK